MFEQASRLKLRFKVEGINGNLSTEDLWDLNINQVDTLAVALKRELNAETESFLQDKKG